MKLLRRLMCFFWWCQDDGFTNSFVATNANNKIVSGTVCCGLVKGCTIRF